MSVPTELHSTLSRTYHTLCILVRQPITEVRAEWNVAADVWEIGPPPPPPEYQMDRALAKQCSFKSWKLMPQKCRNKLKP